MPKKILLYTIGSAGDVYPFIGIGRRLKESGLRVVLITSQYFESQTRSAGLAASFCNSWIVQPDRCRRQGAPLWCNIQPFATLEEAIEMTRECFARYTGDDRYFAK